MHIEALRVAYAAYFCNVPQGSDLLDMHEQYVKALQVDEDLDWSEHEALDSLIPWHEFRDCGPAYLLEAVEVLYSNILTVDL